MFSNKCVGIYFYFIFFCVILFGFNLDFICKRHKNEEIKFLIAEDNMVCREEGKERYDKVQKKQTFIHRLKQRKEMLRNGIVDRKHFLLV
jgi:hypothetical protein